MILTLHNLVSRHDVVLEDDAADRIFRIASSASPHHPAVLAARAEYLFNSRRDGMEPYLARLKDNASLQAATWLLDAAWSARNGDTPRAEASIRRALTTWDMNGRVQPDDVERVFQKRSEK